MMFDSCVLIDALNGHEYAMAAIRGDGNRIISVLSRSEVLAGARSPPADAEARDLIARFVEIPVSVEIADAAGRIRRDRSLKLADAVVLATARLGDFALITRDVRLAAAAGSTPAYTLD